MMNRRYFGVEADGDGGPPDRGPSGVTTVLTIGLCLVVAWALWSMFT